MLANKVQPLHILGFALRLICIYFTGSVRTQWSNILAQRIPRHTLNIMQMSLQLLVHRAWENHQISITQDRTELMLLQITDSVLWWESPLLASQIMQVLSTDAETRNALSCDHWRSRTSLWWNLWMKQIRPLPFSKLPKKRAGLRKKEVSVSVSRTHSNVLWIFHASPPSTGCSFQRMMPPPVHHETQQFIACGHT